MITITLNDNTNKCFNLKNNEREKALYNAWFSMSDDKKYADKRLKITTHANEKLDLKISDIKDCKHEDCVLYDNPEIVVEKKEQRTERPYDRIQRQKQDNMNNFYDILKSQGITPRPSDPFLQEVHKWIDNNPTGSNIINIANIYAKYHRKVYK